MRISILLCYIFIFFGQISCQNPGADRKTDKNYTVDICIYGTTSAGVIAAYAAKKAGKTVLLTGPAGMIRSEEHTSELQSRGHLVCRLLLEKKTKQTKPTAREMNQQAAR